MSNNSNSQILALMQQILNQVQSLASDVQDVKTDMQDVKIRVGSLENNLVYFGTKIQNLEEKVDQRLHDTRPIWQAVLERLDKIETTLEALKTDVEVLKIDTSNVKTDVVIIKQSQERMEKEFQELRLEVLTRLEKIEEQKYSFDFLTLKAARMQMEINELKADVLALQHK